MFEAAVIGASAGGINALKTILSGLEKNFALPVAIVQHIGQSDMFLAEHLGQSCKLKVKEAEDKESLETGKVYLAPSNYHLLVEPDHTFSLSIDDKVNYSRPSVDVLFSSAADAYGAALVGIILTGANSDGAEGARRIKDCGGMIIVQDPKTAESPFMPQAAINMAQVDHVVELKKIALLLNRLSKRGNYGVSA